MATASEQPAATKSKAKAKSLHKSEAIKEQSRYLRGTIDEEMHTEEATYSGPAAAVLKFHGVYMQDDRDLRAERRKQGLDKAHSVMVRTRIPGGKITADQYMTHDQISQELGNRTLRITTRQGFQLHGVLKSDLPATIRRINEALLSTVAACGDIERNVLSCPAPIRDAVRDPMQDDADRFAAHFGPRASSYWDLWVDGEKLGDQQLPEPGPSLVPRPNDDSVEPIYGTTYLPRKFKTAFALPEDNCVDVLTNDLGYVAIVEDGQLVGYDMTVGGGLGVTPSAEKTFRRLADRLTFVSRDDLLRVGEAVVKVQRDLGNRVDRKRARLKYLVHDMGLPAFKAKVEEYLGETLPEPRNIPITGIDDHMGWHEQGDGKLFLGLPIENGRIEDRSDRQIASGLRAYFEAYRTPARLTCLQSILLIDIEPGHKTAIEELLASYNIPFVEQVSTARRWSMACPALPTCGLAVTESERILPDLMSRLEAEVRSRGLDQERFTVRMTGCPNGCARPYVSDIGLVGRSATKPGQPAGTYTVYLGGRPEGDQLNEIYKDYVPFEEIVPEIARLLDVFQGGRHNGESFGQFCARVGLETLRGDMQTDGATT